MKALKELRGEITKFIPVLSSSLHKGSSGKIAIVGGCFEYTGAPYFAAMTGLRVGVDLSHVFCSKHAGNAIKSYSPDLIVHPVLPDEQDPESEIKDAVEKVQKWLPSMTSLVVGPGMGRSKPMLKAVEQILTSAVKDQKPVVIDGDALSSIICESPQIVKGYKKAILTPNFNEYKRLCKAVDIPEESPIEKLSQAFGNITIVQKAEHDLISNGELVWKVEEEGSSRRCGGQGDLTAGAIGTFSFWADKYEGELKFPKMMLASYAACVLTRRCNKNGFEKRGRSMVTQDMIEEIGKSFSSLYDDKSAL
eukprot:TRINITY_DN417_c0_g2_i1.p1 TRINITY_DN417_c0_g2~~TRINITY_DN417_c0_g2_i1.p1  ORF type:complete len:343 (-),score=71.74 TRINITY_DN417_c0_g2_i1:299-1219(-)